MNVNGVRYNVVVSGGGPPLLLLHGFTGSTETWSSLVAEARGRFTTIAVDFLGHGASEIPRDPSRYAMEKVGADLVAILDSLGFDQVAALGYSLGGRLLLCTACEYPQRFRAIVLEGANPGVRDPEKRVEQRRVDEELATFIEQNGVAKFVERWEQKPEFANQPPPLREYLRRERLKNDALGLANALRGAGPGAQTPQHANLAKLTMPALLVVGGEDAMFQGLAKEMSASIPNARIEVVSGAGHTVHLDQPATFNRIVLEFLA